MAEFSRDDLKSAIDAGIISEAQAIQLARLSLERSGVRNQLAAEDEPFEFFQGLNEVFISVGIVLVAVAMVVLAVSAMASGGGAMAQVFMIYLLSLTIAWALAEYLTRYRRLVLPSITLATLIPLGTFLASLVIMQTEWQPENNEVLVLAFPALSAGLFYLRFRLPFALLPLAVFGGLTVMFAVTMIVGGYPVTDIFSDGNLFDLTSSAVTALTALFLGFGIFALAMRFDLSDPHRLTRRSACAFWLHVVAAPAIMNVAGISLLSVGGFFGTVFLFGVIVLISLVAIVIDRRSFLLAGSAYLAALVFNATDRISSATPVVLTFLILGAMIIMLGAFWPNVRRRVLAFLPESELKRRLPPLGKLI